jgi:glyoxylase-like metal-dependent hydrolase (beta-lactamase superfamily II)
MKNLLPLLALSALLAGCDKPNHSFTIQSLLNDGDNALANDLFKGADEDLINTLAPDGETPVACNVFLYTMNIGKSFRDSPTIIKKRRAILIDTGYGGDLQAELENYKQLDPGFSSKDVEAILITHVHFDHVGGLLTADGKAAFPNATLHITAAELEFWKNAEPPLASPELAAAVEKAYEINIITPDGETPVANSDIVAIDAAGHTPGHVVFLMGGKYLFAGDLLHSELLQFSHPEIHPVFDHDPDAALAVRKKLLTRAADNGWFVHFSHVRENGSRRVEKDGDGFKLAPLE